MCLSIGGGHTRNVQGLKTKGINMTNHEAAVNELNTAYESLLTGSNRVTDKLAVATTAAFAAVTESFQTEVQRLETDLRSELTSLRDELNAAHDRIAAAHDRLATLESRWWNR